MGGRVGGRRRFGRGVSRRISWGIGRRVGRRRNGWRERRFIRAHIHRSLLNARVAREVGDDATGDEAVIARIDGTARRTEREIAIERGIACQIAVHAVGNASTAILDQRGLHGAVTVAITRTARIVGENRVTEDKVPAAIINTSGITGESSIVSNRAVIDTECAAVVEHSAAGSRISRHECVDQCYSGIKTLPDAPGDRMRRIVAEDAVVDDEGANINIDRAAVACFTIREQHAIQRD